jgi:hypothetical protein
MYPGYMIISRAASGLSATVVLLGESAWAVVANAGIAAVTKAVVANAVVLLPGDCVVAIVPVGRVGVPVKVGLDRLDLRSRLPWRSSCAESVPVMAPQAVEVTGVTPPTLTTQAAYVPEPVWWFTSTVITPVPELYVSTSPCIWFDAS